MIMNKGLDEELTRLGIEYIFKNEKCNYDNCCEVIEAFAKICSERCGREIKIEFISEKPEPIIGLNQAKEMIANRGMHSDTIPAPVVKFMIREFNNGKSKNSIAQELGISRNTVIKYLKEV